jgi:hypothetical protein
MYRKEGAREVAREKAAFIPNLGKAVSRRGFQ